MTLEEFKENIVDTVTVDCSLPFNVPEKTLDRAIRLSKPFFYKEYEYSLEDRYLVVKEGYQNNPLFEKERTIILPECVYSVYFVRDQRGSGLFGGANKDFSYDKLIVEQSGVTNLNPENLSYAVFQMLYLDIVEQMTTTTVSFNFNHLTHKLVLNGEIRHDDLILQIGKKIPDEELFDDDLFFRYVAGRVKADLGRSLGTVQMNLIGGADVDFASIKEEGKEEMLEVKEELKDVDSPDFFFVCPS